MTQERFTDEVDAAQHLQARLNEESVAAVRAELQPQTHPDFDGVHCVDDGAEIPQTRLALGKIRCIYCQELFEKRNFRR